MGRHGPNATPNHQAPETIDNALPPNDEKHDLYEPPSNYQKPPPPPPPQQQYHDQMPQAFPPPQYETAQPFPPVQNPAHNNQFHQPNVQFQHQQVYAQPGVPINNGGVQMGQYPQHTRSPSPFINNINPAAQIQNQLPTQAWSSGLFDCMNDPDNALITACFPCVTFGQIAEIVDSGGTTCNTSALLYGAIAFCIAVPCIMSCSYRTKMRSRFGLMESPAPDWLVHCFCEWCALCQEYRELKARDLDPAIGWAGNVAKQQQTQQFTMAAPVQQRMM